MKVTVKTNTGTFYGCLLREHLASEVSKTYDAIVDAYKAAEAEEEAKLPSEWFTSMFDGLDERRLEVEKALETRGFRSRVKNYNREYFTPFGNIHGFEVSAEKVEFEIDFK